MPLRGSSAWRETTFKVIVTRLPRGSFEVSVKCQDGSDYATTRHAHLDVALKMAVPYMAYAAEPDPFEALGRVAER